MRTARLRAAAAACAVALLVSCGEPYDLAPLGPTERAAIAAAAARVDGARYADLLARLAPPRIAGDRAACEAVLLAELSAAAGNAAVAVPVATTEGTARNLFVEVPGTEPGLPAVMACAHWDWEPGSPGMDDDASGCAGVVECARALRESGIAFRRALRFALFDLEEEGLAGSRGYVSSGPSGGLPGFFINMDCIAYADGGDLFSASVGMGRGDWIAVLAPHAMAAELADFARTAAVASPELDYLLSSVPATYPFGGFLSGSAARSDNHPLWEAGSRGLFLSDAFPLRSPDYHGAGDSLAALDPALAARALRAAVGLLAVRAQSAP